MANVAFIHTNKNFTLLALNLWEDQSPEYNTIMFEGIWTCSKERRTQLIEIMEGVVGARGATFASAYRFIERAGIFTDKDYRPKKTKTKNVNKKEHRAILLAFFRFMTSQHQKAGYGEYKLKIGKWHGGKALSYENIEQDLELESDRISRDCDLYDDGGWPNSDITEYINGLLQNHAAPFMDDYDVRDYFNYLSLCNSYDYVACYYPRTIHAVQDEYINKVKDKYGLSSYYEKTNVKKAILFNRLWISRDDDYHYDILTRKETARAHMCHLNSLIFTRSYRIPSTHSGVDFFDKMNTIFQGVQAEFNLNKTAQGLYMKAAIHDTPPSPKPLLYNYNKFIITFQVFQDTYIDENCEFKPLFEDGLLRPEAQEYMNNNLY